MLTTQYFHTQLINQRNRKGGEQDRTVFKKKKGVVCFNEKLSNMTILKRKESSVKEGQIEHLSKNRERKEEMVQKGKSDCGAKCSVLD